MRNVPLAAHRLLSPRRTLETTFLSHGLQFYVTNQPLFRERLLAAVFEGRAKGDFQLPPGSILHRTGSTSLSWKFPSLFFMHCKTLCMTRRGMGVGWLVMFQHENRGKERGLIGAYWPAPRLEFLCVTTLSMAAYFTRPDKTG